MQSKKKLILIVDDNPDNITMLGSLLTKNGYTVGAAPDGHKALKFVENKLPDLILLDIMMPGMDGFEVCVKLKSDSLTKHIPVIFLTAKTGVEDIVKGFKTGGADYVTKPFNAEELLVRVNTHIEMKILRGFLPICASCKSIRDEKGYWRSVEEYVETHSDSKFSHSLCNQCVEKLYGDYEWYKKSDLKKKITEKSYLDLDHIRARIRR